MTLDIETIDWTKGNHLVPAIVQNATNGCVLMLGYMNRPALEHSLSSSRVTFFSRSRQCLWTKGETSGHWLDLIDVRLDCDRDCLLILAVPNGPACHRNTESCFDSEDATTALEPVFGELHRLDGLIAQRKRDRPEHSYTAKLIASGTLRVAQKVGEEGVETALAGVAQSKEALLDEAADLLYHLGVLLHMRDSSLVALLCKLRERRRHSNEILANS